MSQQQASVPVSPLRRRMLDDMAMRGLHEDIRHYGLLATGRCKANIARARELLAVSAPPDAPKPASSAERRTPCPCCGGRMLVIKSFRGRRPRPRSAPAPMESRMKAP